jgi:hypothetical protein
MTPVLDRTSLEQFRTIVARRLGLHYEDEKLDYLAEVWSWWAAPASSPTSSV